MTDHPTDTRASLPWPRCADDGTPLGIDLATKAEDVRKLVMAGFARSALANGIDPDDLVQTVLVAILRRNRMPCAFDPRRSSFGHYVWRVTRSQFVNLTETEKRHHDGSPTDREDDRRPRDVVDDRLGAEERYEAAEEANPEPTPLWRQSLDARAVSGPQLDLFGVAAMLPPAAPANDAEPPSSSSRPMVRSIARRNTNAPTLFAAVQ